LSASARFGLTQRIICICEQEVPSNATTYTADAMCGEPATTVSSRDFRDVGWIHDAVLVGLAPGARYSYRVGASSGVFSDVFLFNAAPAAGPGALTNFLAYGDLGTSFEPTWWCAFSCMRRVCVCAMLAMLCDFSMLVYLQVCRRVEHDNDSRCG
jgi:hypothetical protein